MNKNTTGTAYFSMQDRIKFRICFEDNGWLNGKSYCGEYDANCQGCPFNIDQRVWNAMRYEYRIKRRYDTHIETVETRPKKELLVSDDNEYAVLI